MGVMLASMVGTADGEKVGVSEASAVGLGVGISVGVSVGTSVGEIESGKYTIDVNYYMEKQLKGPLRRILQKVVDLHSNVSRGQ